jgi:hypothetical protein
MRWGDHWAWQKRRLLRRIRRRFYLFVWGWRLIFFALRRIVFPITRFILFVGFPFLLRGRVRRYLPVSRLSLSRRF